MPQLTNEQLHSRLTLVVGWIKHADAKAGVVLSFAAATSALAASQLGDGPVSVVVAFVLTIAAALSAAYQSWAALVPRVKPQEQRRSLVFFGTIADYSSVSDFEAALEGQSEADESTDLLHQVLELSRIAQTKFDHVDKAVNHAAGAAVLLVISLGMMQVTA